jgi:hypothetical protein
MGRILILVESMGGRSEGGSSRPSEWRPRPVEREWAGLIQMYLLYLVSYLVLVFGLVVLVEGVTYG